MCEYEDNPTPAEFAHFVTVARWAVVPAVVMAAVALLMWVLVAWGVGISCAGQAVKQGYNPRDFLWLFLGTGFIAFVFGMMCLASGSRINFTDTPLILFEFRSIRISNGMVAIYAAVLGFLAISGFMVGTSVTHYQTLRTNCIAVTLPA